jgi:hypothetical protein
MRRLRAAVLHWIPWQPKDVKVFPFRVKANVRVKDNDLGRSTRSSVLGGHDLQALISFISFMRKVSPAALNLGRVSFPRQELQNLALQNGGVAWFSPICRTQTRTFWSNSVP